MLLHSFQKMHGEEGKNIDYSLQKPEAAFLVRISLSLFASIKSPMTTLGC